MILWRSLLGRFLSLYQLVPGGHLRMRSLQLVLRYYWDFSDRSVFCRMDQLLFRRSFFVGRAKHMFWSDASDMGWTRGPVCFSYWPLEMKSLSIYLRGLRAIWMGLQHFSIVLSGSSMALICNNTTLAGLLYKEVRGDSLSRLFNH